MSGAMVRRGAQPFFHCPECGHRNLVSPAQTKATPHSCEGCARLWFFDGFEVYRAVRCLQPGCGVPCPVAVEITAGTLMTCHACGGKWYPHTGRVVPCVQLRELEFWCSKTQARFLSMFERKGLQEVFVFQRHRDESATKLLAQIPRDGALMVVAGEERYVVYSPAGTEWEHSGFEWSDWACPECACGGFVGCKGCGRLNCLGAQRLDKRGCEVLTCVCGRVLNWGTPAHQAERRARLRREGRKPSWKLSGSAGALEGWGADGTRRLSDGVPRLPPGTDNGPLDL